MDESQYVSTSRRRPVQTADVHRIYSRKRIEQALLETFELTGGVSRLATWANKEENYGEFIKLLVKIVPKDAVTDVGGSVIQWRSNMPPSPLSRPDEVADGEFVEVISGD